MTDPFPWRMAAEAIARRFAEESADGRLQPGDRLPTYVELAASCSIAVGTARKAVALLVNLGHLHVEPGVGIFLRQVPQLPLDAPMTPLPLRGVSQRLAEMAQRLAEVGAHLEELGTRVRDLELEQLDARVRDLETQGHCQ